MLSERIQSQRILCYIQFYFWEMSGIGKCIRTESRLITARAWGRGRGKWGVTDDGYGFLFLRVMKIF
jgi:hypothetical protein